MTTPKPLVNECGKVLSLLGEGGHLELRIKPILKTEHLWKPFSESHCLMTISVGQEVHEGEKFLASVQLVNAHFQRCTLCVDDTLQRYTLALGQNKESESCLEEALYLGDLWLKRNEKSIQAFELPLKLIRWEDWRFHSDFEKFKAELKLHYQEEASFREIFLKTVEGFLARYLPRLKIFVDPIRAQNLSLEYLFEECSALRLWAQTGYDYEVYPNRRNWAMSLVHELYVRAQGSEAASEVFLKFKNRKQFRPQVLEEIV